MVPSTNLASSSIAADGSGSVVASSRFSTLPLACFGHILSFLDGKEYERLAGTSRELTQITIAGVNASAEVARFIERVMFQLGDASVNNQLATIHSSTRISHKSISSFSRTLSHVKESVIDVLKTLNEEKLASLENIDCRLLPHIWDIVAIRQQMHLTDSHYTLEEEAYSAQAEALWAMGDVRGAIRRISRCWDSELRNNTLWPLSRTLYAKGDFEGALAAADAMLCTKMQMYMYREIACALVRAEHFSWAIEVGKKKVANQEYRESLTISLIKLAADMERHDIAKDIVTALIPDEERADDLLRWYGPSKKRKM